MKQRIADNRLSLWELNIRSIEINHDTYLLDSEPERGGSCLVYRAKKRIQRGTKVYEQQVLLKEFYPLLNPDQGAGIVRKEDGSFRIPEATRESGEYRMALRHFEKAYEVMLEMAKSNTGADHTVIPISTPEAFGTCYIEEADDGGVSLSKLLQKEDGQSVNFKSFLEIYRNVMLALYRLHGIGYYHLDFAPKNISCTGGGNIKLFDTDTFMKQEELGNLPILRYTEGFAAPELIYVVEHGKNATELIGPWTDIYSLTQVLCWYLYGHPLEEGDVEDALEELEDKVQSTFGIWECRLPRKGMYRLREFIRKNLSYDYEERTSSVKEVYREMEKIKEYLFCEMVENGVPVDNFKEIEEIAMVYEEELERLEELLLPERKGPIRGAAAVVTGASKAEREHLGRSFATLHQMQYSEIVEIHTKDFGKLREQIKVYTDTFDRQLTDIMALQCTSEDPVLFLLFDEQEKNALRLDEIRELEKLLRVKNCHVLILGKYNRCGTRGKDFGSDILLPSINLEPEEQNSNLADIMEIMDILDYVEQNSDIPKWSVKKTILSGLLGMIITFLGLMLAFLGGQDDLKLYDFGEMVLLQGLGVMTQYGTWIHILGNAISMVGLVVSVHTIYDFVTPYGWRYFLREFHWTIMAYGAVLFTTTLPSFFAYHNGLDYTLWQIPDRLQGIMEAVLWGGGLVVMILWIFTILSIRRKRKRWLLVPSILLLVMAIVHVVMLTRMQMGELVLFIGYWLAIYLVKGLLYEK